MAFFLIVATILVIKTAKTIKDIYVLPSEGDLKYIERSL